MLIEAHHRSRDCAHPPAPNLRLHAALHLIVENQAAAPDLSVADALRRLVGEGLTRHESSGGISTWRHTPAQRALCRRPHEMPTLIHFTGALVLEDGRPASLDWGERKIAMWEDTGQGTSEYA
jgi:hypothetical protein